MTAPNIAIPKTATGKTTPVALSSTLATQILSNASGSNKVLRVKGVIIANVDGVNVCDITLNLFSQAALAGTATALLSTFPIPPKSSLFYPLPFYVEEDRSFGATAGAANDLVVTPVYEEIG